MLRVRAFLHKFKSIIVRKKSSYFVFGFLTCFLFYKQHSYILVVITIFNIPKAKKKNLLHLKRFHRGKFLSFVWVWNTRNETVDLAKTRELLWFTDDVSSGFFIFIALVRSAKYSHYCVTIIIRQLDIVWPFDFRAKVKDLYLSIFSPSPTDGKEK